MSSVKAFIRKLSGVVLCTAFAVSSGAEAADDAKAIPVADLHRSAPVDFQKEVLPILSTSCLACHNKTKAKAKLDLETPAAIRKGGESGPAAVPGKGQESLLVKAAAHAADVDSPMPPPHNTANAPDLNPNQLGLIRLWIDQGASGEVRDSVASLKWVSLAPVVQPIYAVATTSDGQFAACGRGNQIDIYNLPTGRLVAHLADPHLGTSAHRDVVESLAFSPAGTVLASGSYREIKLWHRPAPVKSYVLSGLGESTQCAVVSPDGKVIAAGDADGKIRLFDASTGKTAGELAGHDSAVTALCFSRDGSRLVSASTDMTSRIWDVPQRKLFCKIKTPCELRAVAWVESGKRIATGGTDGVIRLWTIPDSAESEMTLSASLKGHEGAINALAGFTSNNRQILSAGEDGTLRIWDTASGQIVRQAKHGAAVISIAVRKDGKRFASAGTDNTVRLWNADDAKQVAESKGDPSLLEASIASERSLGLASAEIAYHKARVSEAEKDVAAQSDRSQKARAALAVVVKEIEAKQHGVDAAKEASKAVETEITARKRSAQAVELAESLFKSLQESLDADKGGASDRAQLATAGDALKKARDSLTAMKLDERRKAAEAAVVSATTELTKATAAKTGADQEVTAAGQTAGAASALLARATLALRAAESERVKREAHSAAAKKAYADSGKPIRWVAFSPDGLLLAAAGDDGIVRTTYADKGSPGSLIGDRKSLFRAVAFINDSSLIAFDQRGAAATTWDLSAPWTLHQSLGSADGASPIADRVTSLDFSRSGNLLASGGGVPSRGGEVKLWDPRDGKLLKSFDEVHADTVNCVRFSPDGHHLACGSADRFIRLIDLDSGKVSLSLEGHQHHVLGLAFRHDGHTIATAGADNTLRFWNPDTGDRKAVVTAFDKEVTSVCFIGDTDLALVTSGTGGVKSYHVDGSEDRSFPGSTGFVYAACVTEDGATIVAGGENGVLRAWDAGSARPIALATPADVPGK